MEKIHHIILQLFNSYYEFFGSLTGLWCVWLALRQNILNWPVAMVSVFCYSIFFYQSRFYSDAALQLVFFGFQVYGWYVWGFFRNTKTELNIGTLSCRTHLKVLGITALLSLLWTIILPLLKPDQSLPALDATTTCMSITAIALQARKKIENWWWWIAVDLVYIPMYFYREFYATALLYCIFIVLAVAGLQSWRRSLQSIQH